MNVKLLIAQNEWRDFKLLPAGLTFPLYRQAYMASATRLDPTHHNTEHRREFNSYSTFQSVFGINALVNRVSPPLYIY